MSAGDANLTVYDRLGARPVVNCRGVYSELGGAIISADVWGAMTEANELAASMSELLAVTGRRIAELLGAEAGRVTPGAAAAIALGTAACMTKGDGPAAERLPDTTGLPGDVLLQRVQQPAYKYARMVWMTGARIRLVGSEAETSRAELEDALDPERVAAVFVPGHLDEASGAVPLRELAPLAHERGIPVLVDAAFLNYPPESMRRFTDAGADLVCFSAKYFYGPNGGGFVVGRAGLVGAVEAVDFTGYESGPWLIFGRPFKLDRHTVVGTTLALEEWLELDHAARWRSYAALVDQLGASVAEPPGRLGRRRASSRWRKRWRTRPSTAWSCRSTRRGPEPRRRTSSERLTRANPRIAVHLWDDTLIVAVDTMLPEQCAYVGEQLRAALASA